MTRTAGHHRDPSIRQTWRASHAVRDGDDDRYVRMQHRPTPKDSVLRPSTGRMVP